MESHLEKEIYLTTRITLMTHVSCSFFPDSYSFFPDTLY